MASTRPAHCGGAVPPSSSADRLLAAAERSGESDISSSRSPSPTVMSLLASSTVSPSYARSDLPSGSRPAISPASHAPWAATKGSARAIAGAARLTRMLSASFSDSACPSSLRFARSLRYSLREPHASSAAHCCDAPGVGEVASKGAAVARSTPSSSGVMMDAPVGAVADRLPFLRLDIERVFAPGGGPLALAIRPMRLRAARRSVKWSSVRPELASESHGRQRRTNSSPSSCHSSASCKRIASAGMAAVLTMLPRCELSRFQPPVVSSRRDMRSKQ